MTHGSLALKLRVLRAKEALTIEQAAARARVTPETISDAERGRRHPYLPTLRKLAEAYDVPVEELLAEEPDSARAGASLKAQVHETGPAQSRASISSAVQAAIRMQIKEDRQVANHAIDSTLPQSYLKRHRNRAMKRLLECSRDELAEEYLALMEKFVHQEQKHGRLQQKHGLLEGKNGLLEKENGRLEKENGRLTEENKQLRAKNARLRE